MDERRILKRLLIFAIVLVLTSIISGIFTLRFCSWYFSESILKTDLAIENPYQLYE